MDKNKKLEKLLEMLEHPDKYSEEQLSEMLSDTECREYYDILVDARQAMAMGKENDENAVPDIDDEWKRFSATQGMSEQTRWRIVSVACVAVLLVSGLTFATVSVVNNIRKTNAIERTVDENESVKAVETNAEKEKTDTIAAQPIIFDNVDLQTIMEDVATKYGVNVVFKNDESKSLRMYLQLDSGMTLDEVIEMLSHFDKINVSQNDDTIIIE